MLTAASRPGKHSALLASFHKVFGVWCFKLQVLEACNIPSSSAFMLSNLPLQFGPYCCSGEVENTVLELQCRWKPAHEGFPPKEIDLMNL